MNATGLALAGILLAAFSGIPGLFLWREGRRGEVLAAWLVCLAGLLGMAGGGVGLLGGAGPGRVFPWPATGNGFVGVDPLSAFFLLPVFLLGAAGSVYGLRYWAQRDQPVTGARLRFFWGTLVAGMGLLVISRHALTFLLGWEFMALSAFFLVGMEEDRPECRQASWIYLVSTHLGTLALFAMFTVWHRATGSYLLEAVSPGSLGVATLHILQLLALVGFGTKAGVLPMHFWLPGAHAAAPSHVSALMSGVVIKMGIYGLLRWYGLLPDTPGIWGVVVLALGVISGVMGVAYALGQHDLKRLLAYHSVENIGIILMGLGVALLGRATGRVEWVAFGLAGCLLHVWNHGLFKALLFLGAGSVVHATGTREMDRLGGLAHRMPWTAVLFLAGAVAICGLPPLNGFVSEWLVYMGMLSGLQAGRGGMLLVFFCAPALALIGALALACFVKAFGTVFLGEPRRACASRVHEAGRPMLAPMALLALLCLAIGLLPLPAAQAAGQVVAYWSGSGGVTDALTAVVYPQAAMLGVGARVVAAALAVAGLAAVMRRTGWRIAVTWDCGYAAPVAKMQYTSSSFAESIVALLARVLRPREHRPAVTGLFPGVSAFSSHVDDGVLDRLLLPGAGTVERAFGWFRRFQQGLTQQYLLYMLVAVLLMLCTLFPFRALLVRWLTW